MMITWGTITVRPTAFETVTLYRHVNTHSVRTVQFEYSRRSGRSVEGCQTIDLYTLQKKTVRSLRLTISYQEYDIQGL
jgi:hypothetical protein